MRLWKTTVLSFTQTQDLGHQTGSALQRLGSREEFPTPAGRVRRRGLSTASPVLGILEETKIYFHFFKIKEHKLPTGSLNVPFKSWTALKSIESTVDIDYLAFDVFGVR